VFPSPTSFDAIGGQKAMQKNIQDLRTALFNKGWIAANLADTNVRADTVQAGAVIPTAAELGAVYNYLLLARGSAGGVHNPRYTRQLFYDSYEVVTGGPPPSMTRP
jgi:hypothetical protein